ncbi:MAG TPA: glucose 1-dehydrogenase [Bradyrhizobium sp.]|nr:glucose 1-dehydrogenase [Bradyrhizobium sp.]
MSAEEPAKRRVEGKVALVTGAASGIGRSATLMLAREGARLVATDVQDEKGARLLADLRAFGSEADYHHHDVTSEDDWRAVIARTKARFGRLDVLVNNAGIGLSCPVVDMSLADWRRQTAVNLDGVFLGVKHALPVMREGGGGSIINVSSIAGIKASPNVSGYCATKGGVRLFTKAVALECAAARDGVRVNSLHPGITETAIWDTLIGTAEEGSNAGPARGPTLDKLTARAVPLGFKAMPEDIANGILWLASDESRYVTGAELVIDGGRSIG